MAERKAAVRWEGNLLQGEGLITEVGSGALAKLPISWSARTETPGGKTSPEELLAAAQAACFAMALSGALTRAGHPPQAVDVAATCTFDKKPEGGWKVATMQIEVHGHVPGIDAAAFERIAAETGLNCPISGALRGNVEIRVTAHLEHD